MRVEVNTPPLTQTRVAKVKDDIKCHNNLCMISMCNIVVALCVSKSRRVLLDISVTGVCGMKDSLYGIRSGRKW